MIVSKKAAAAYTTHEVVVPGRCHLLHFKDFVVFNLYLPPAKWTEEREEILGKLRDAIR